MLFNNVYCYVCFTLNFKVLMSFSLAKESTVEKLENSGITLLKEANESIMSMDRFNSATNNITKTRSKRQSGGSGKFSDAAKMPQVKIMRLFTQLFKNLWDSSYVGGAHPFHPDVPNVVVTLYKQKIVEFFVPNVGEDPSKPSY